MEIQMEMTKYELAVQMLKAHGITNPDHKLIVQLADLIEKPINKIDHLVRK